jgi:hypothetical protein
MAFVPFKWRVRDRAVAQVLLPPQRWERRVVLFLAVWRVLMEEVWLGYGGGFFLLLSFLSHFLGKHA